MRFLKILFTVIFKENVFDIVAKTALSSGNISVYDYIIKNTKVSNKFKKGDL